MFCINATGLRRQLFKVLEQTVKYNEPVSVTTKDGNAVLLSEEDYNSLMETIYLTSIPGMGELIREGLNTPIEECVPENEVQW